MEFVSGDIFELDAIPEIPQDVVLAHCVASDFGMYGGIAREFVRRYNMKGKLLKYANENCKVEFFSGYRCYPELIGKAVKIDKVYNLVTKRFTANSPFYDTLELALQDMKQQMLRNDDKILAIPDMIGCGIDGLNRERVIQIIDSTFSDTDISVFAVNRPSHTFI